jgi:uncharacterized protein GlcG (DUF336 family)
MLRLAEANRAITAALAKARELSAHVSVSVCDPYGHLLAHQRMDHVFVEVKASHAVYVSQPQAVAALIGKAAQGATAKETERHQPTR